MRNAATYNGIVLAAVLFLSLWGLSCKTQASDSASSMNISRVEYRYGDSSVPPPYHRSYSIVVTSDSVSTVVDSYGDVVAQKQRTLQEGELEKVIAALEMFMDEAESEA